MNATIKSLILTLAVSLLSSSSHLLVADDDAFFQEKAKQVLSKKLAYESEQRNRKWVTNAQAFLLDCGTPRTDENVKILVAASRRKYTDNITNNYDKYCIRIGQRLKKIKNGLQAKHTAKQKTNQENRNPNTGN